jgi:exopolysaccharide production protein ExoQ
MAKLIASLCCIIGIASLFRLDREKNARVSKALWVPVVYLLINCSKPLSEWLDLAPSNSADGIYSSPADAALNFVLLGLALIVLIFRSSKVSSLLRGNIAVLLFYSYAALSMIWSDFPYVTLKHWTKGIEDVAIVLLVLTDNDPVMAVRRILTRAAFILIPLSPVLGLYYPALGRVFTKGGVPEFVGVATQKNQLGQTCVILGLGSLWCFVTAYLDRTAATRRRRLLAHGIVLAIVGWLFQSCQSLTSTVAFVLSGSVMVLASRPSIAAKPARLRFLVAAALAVAAVPVFIAPTLVETMGRDATLSGRTEIWTVLPTLVRNPWLGAGYETFLMGPRLVAARNLMDASFQEAHNGYLEVYLNLGWIGVFLFGCLLFTGYRKLIAAVRRDPAVFSLGLAFFVAVLIEGLSEAPFRMLTPTLFFLLWGIMGASKEAISMNPSGRSLVYSRQKRGITPMKGSYTKESEIRISV